MAEDLEETVSFNRDQLAAEWRVAGFIGAFALWEAVRQHHPRVRELYAEQLLLMLGRAAFHDRRGLALSPREADAFRYAGLDPVEVWKKVEDPGQRTDVE